MIRRAWAASGLAAAALTTGACGAGGRVPQPEPQPRVSVAPPPGPAASAGPGRDIECAGTEAHVATTMSAAPGDLVVGSITWPGLRAWATAKPRDFGDPATGDYKVGAEVRAGATVTVSVAGGGAGLRYGQG